MPTPTELVAALHRVLAENDEIRFALVGTPEGQVVAEAGSTEALPYRGLASVIREPNTISVYYREAEQNLVANPQLVPQLYGQGEMSAVIGPPMPNFLVAAIGVAPPSYSAASPTDRAAWLRAYRARVWRSIQDSFAHLRGVA